MIANLSLSLPQEIKLNSSSTFLGKELTEESADMIGQKVHISFIKMSPIFLLSIVEHCTKDFLDELR
jgi:hypothetical protein